jgi:hypothetical protein
LKVVSSVLVVSSTGICTGTFVSTNAPTAIPDHNATDVSSTLEATGHHLAAHHPHVAGRTLGHPQGAERHRRETLDSVDHAAQRDAGLRGRLVLLRQQLRR